MGTTENWLNWQAIRALADVEVAKDVTSVRYVSRHDPAEPKLSVPLSDGMVLYARDTWRDPWRTSLKRVPVPVVLVTAFHDAHVRTHALEMFDGQIQHWFGVQVETMHPKLTGMPIGIDGRDLPTLHEAIARPWHARDILCLANFQQRTPERKELHQWCKTQPWITTDGWNGPIKPRTMLEYYTLLGRSKFVLSPAGRGWDCYRTYEALAMGAVPIVKRRRPLSDVVDGLPVVLVDHWSEVTPALLARGRPDGTLERITQAYWNERIQSYGTHLQSAHASGG
jgi:hypothetical protein